MTSRMVAVDSLVANEFKVEINGETILGVFRVGGLTTFKLDMQGGETAAKQVRPPLQLVKMVQRDANNVFNKWLRETIGTGPGHSRPRRTLSVVAVDDGIETRRWTAKGAWISEVSYSQFDTGSSEMVEEIVTIYYDELQESWPATPNLE